MHSFLWVILLLLGLPLAGIAYQSLGECKDRRRYLRLGRLVHAGLGQRLFVTETGSIGPTIVLESGIAATSQNWSHIQQSLSSCARTVSYDRAGLGWSSASRTQRTPSNVVRELRTMLQQAGIAPPYLLVGHSFGGLVVRHFAAHHPEEVVGVVLVDAMRTEEWPPINQAQLAHLRRGVNLARMGVLTARFGLARLAITSLLCRSGRASQLLFRAAGNGGLHVMDRVTCEVGKMPREVWPIVAAHWSSPKFYRGLEAHVGAVPATVREMHDAKPIEGIPVVLLTPASAQPLSSEALRRIGPTTRQVLAHRSGHWVHLDEPELVLQTIRDVIAEIQSPLPTEPELAQC
jgi:pimeloyl-ACP methyl ester carboxylesterase